MGVINAWVGANTSSGAVVACRVDTGPVRIAVADNAAMTSPTFHGPESVDANDATKVTLSGLEPGTRYWWQVEDNGALDTSLTGQLLTTPAVGVPASYVVGVSSCAAGTNSPGTGFVTGTDARVSNHPVFDTLRQRALTEGWAALAYIGDRQYWDLGSGLHGVTGGASVANYRTTYDDVLAQPRQAALHASVPTWYVWDDHDFERNDSDGTAANKANAAQVFRERVPHFDLDDSGGIWQATQVGRVLWVMSDVRYYRSPNAATDDASKTMLGTDQKTWLDDLLATTNAAALVWLMPDQWLGVSADSWASFQTEQAEILAMLEDRGWLDRMVMVGADRHALGLDTGTLTPGGFPYLQASSLDSDDGETAPALSRFDTGPDSPGSDRYGTVEIIDQGTHIAIVLSGWIGTTLWGSHTHTIAVATAPAVATTRVVEQTVAGSHTARFEARAVVELQTGDDPDGVGIEILSGDVRLDATADVHATLQLETTGDLWPRNASGLLAPFGQEIFVRRGIDLGSSILWFPLGYFRIDSVEQDDATDGPIRITGSDRMSGVIDGRFTSPRQLAAGSVVGEVIRELVTEVHPGAEVVFDDSLEFGTLARAVVVEESRHEAIKELVHSAGKVLHWDGAGRLQIRTAPDPTVPIWHVRAGRRGVLVQAGRALTRAGVRNGLVARGEGAASDEDPVQVLVVDDGPNSPTRWGGRFGRVPRFYSSPMIATEAQAEATARAMLRRNLGMPYRVDFSTVPNPAMRPWDPTRIVHDDGTREIHVIETLTVPLDVTTAMAATTQEQTAVLLRRA